MVKRKKQQLRAKYETLNPAALKKGYPLAGMTAENEILSNLSSGFLREPTGGGTGHQDISFSQLLWYKLRTTNAIERIFFEARRSKTRPMLTFVNLASWLSPITNK